MSRYYSLETIRSNAYDVTLANGAKHRCIDPDALLDIEPADVRENVRGEWGRTKNGFIYCSNCEKTWYDNAWTDNWHYCPNCGAEMRTIE